MENLDPAATPSPDPDRLRRVEIRLLGVGRVGSVLVSQLASRQCALVTERGVDLRLSGVAGSRRALDEPGGLDPATAVEKLAGEGRPYDPRDWLAPFLARREGGRILVDCTASAEVAALYGDVLAAGVSVVTANKLAPAGPAATAEPLLAAPRFYCETVVGAGLPVVAPLRSLVATGDRVHRIEGVLSGTLGYLMAELASGGEFSSIVRRAHELGYTEPDPREDLSGRDVSRKLLVLARLAGRRLEPEDVAVEPLLPEGWAELSLEEFWRRLPELDTLWAERRSAAAEGRRLAYLARLDGDVARVSLESLPAGHPAAGLTGTDNLIAVESERYDETPWVVRGPGAGPAVTAAGVFGDILRAVAEG